MRLLGLDPGLQHTGWGIVDAHGNPPGSRLSFVAAGTIHTDPKQSLADRLVEIHDGLKQVIDLYQPTEAAVEETFVNKNPTSTLKLGLARGVVLMTPASYKLPVAEYPANLIKKSVVGAGHAGKEQVQMMVRVLLPASSAESPDAADALAVAICHAHHLSSLRRWGAKDFREVAR
ncbi:crossover junction endodeoxyribonuclease RuvC [Dongia soli]|uniref:Crossover junction endodeoxyribonuclease RuvC n=1 Tax=Dongia soli TaxID=600628 RepID=A0ABU5EBZ7_9PROT|nr:crossover junction endodeoxyribonuclease RuvC [Dongia soli]MDY0883386.1 crossover junction endodeoxyribonuclease RuvC [Dongia soli]